MATSTEEILIRMGLDAADVKKSMDGVQSMAQSWAGRMAKSIAGAFAFGAVVSQINEVINTFDDLKDRADNLGVGTDFLQGMSKISKSDAVGGVESFNKAISELSVRLGTAKNGGKEAIAAFEKFGITLDQIQSLNSEGMFYLIADKISAIPDPAQRAAASFELLGKAGKNLVGIMANGAPALKEAVDQTEKLDAAAVLALASYKDHMESWGNWFDVWKAKILVGLTEIGPTIGKIANIKGTFADRKAKGEANAEAAQAARDKKIDDELEKERLKSIEEGQKRVNAQTDYAARAAAGKAQQEKEAAALLEKQVGYAKQLNSLFKQAKDIKHRGAMIDVERPTIEALAGRDYVGKLDSMYGAGGKFDLEKGDGPFAKIAQQALLAKKQQMWDVIHGNAEFNQDGELVGGQAFLDRKKRMGFENKLLQAGIATPEMEFRAMRESLSDIQDNIASLYRKADNEGITINTKD